MVVPPWKWSCHESGVWLSHPGSGTAMTVAYSCATRKWYCHESGVWLCHPGSGTAMSVANGCATLEMIQRIASYCGTKIILALLEQ